MTHSKSARDLTETRSGLHRDLPGTCLGPARDLSRTYSGPAMDLIGTRPRLVRDLTEWVLIRSRESLGRVPGKFSAGLGQVPGGTEQVPVGSPAGPR